MRWNRNGAGGGWRKVLGGRELHLRGVSLSERNDSEEKCGLILNFPYDELCLIIYYKFYNFSPRFIPL